MERIIYNNGAGFVCEVEQAVLILHGDHKGEFQLTLNYFGDLIVYLTGAQFDAMIRIEP